MTQNQINNAKLQEDIRHNKASERLSKAQNAYNKEHYERSDAIAESHYMRSDQASLISANASAINAQANSMNAETNRRNYELQYEIEHTLEKLPRDGRTISYYNTTTGSEVKAVIPNDITVSGAQKLINIGSSLFEQETKRAEAGSADKYYQAHAESEQANVLNRLAGAGSSVLNSAFGKGGVVQGLKSLLYGG